ncbi:MAG: DUF1840 domain-containing protein [Rubrivivax sp.]|jgi:hypothetical protein
MLYRFRSKASADVLMLEPQAEGLLKALGREPSAQGIIEPAAMPDALAKLRAAIELDEQARARMPSDDAQREAAALAAGRDPVPLRGRWWPMVEMLRRCHAEDAPIVWGV